MKVYELLLNLYSMNKKRVAVIENEQEYTYQELKEKIDSQSMTLYTEGVDRMCFVLLFFDNTIDFIVSFFSVLKCGAIVIPLYTKTGIDKIRKIISFYNIQFVLTVKRYNEILDALQPLINTGFIMTCGSISTIKKNKFKKSVMIDSKMKNTAMILFTSGTTNIPKAVMLSHNNITTNVKSISAYLKLEYSDNLLLMKNINHTSSIVGEMLVSIYNKTTLIFSSKIPKGSIIQNLIERYNVTVFFAVPILLINLLNELKRTGKNISSLRKIHFYGASISENVIVELNEVFPDTDLIYSYGLTEASPRVTYIEKPEILNKIGSSGKPIKNVKLRIVNDENRNAKPYEIGEIIIKGPNIMLGYYKNRDLTRIKIRKNFLYTGDLGYFDKDNFLYIKGRKDSLIIQSGKNIYPEEIENVLSNHIGISEAFVSSTNDNLYGKRIIAYIVLKDGYYFDKIELIKFCKKYLEDYKIPSNFYIIEKLPKTISEKIKRNV